MTLTNFLRANRIARLIHRYYDASLVDLLADARHWCDRHDQCYGDLDRIAHDHYLAELWAKGRPR